MTERLQHWRCPECGRLYSDSDHGRDMFLDQVWCLGQNQFAFRAPDAPDPDAAGHWVAMERLEEQYYVCLAPPWPDPLDAGTRERADAIVAQFAYKGARLLVRIQADWWDDGGPR